MPEDKTRADGSQTLERGLRALVILADHPDGMTASNLATMLGVHRSVAYRLLSSLTQVGFADRDVNAKYYVGLGILALADRVRPSVREAATPVLRRLAAELEATAFLVEIVGDAAITTAVEAPPITGPHFSYRVGNRGKLDRGAAALAALTSVPVTDGEPPRVDRARRAGYAISHGEVVPGAVGVAAPINARHKHGPASITIITDRKDIVERAIPLVKSAANEVSQRVDGLSVATANKMDGSHGMHPAH